VPDILLVKWPPLVLVGVRAMKPLLYLTLILFSGLVFAQSLTSSENVDGSSSKKLRPLVLDPVQALPEETEMLQPPDQAHQTERLRQQYQTMLAQMEFQKAREQHQQDVANQSTEFSRRYLQLSSASPDFPDKFVALLKEFPLAAEDEFSQRLIERGRIILRQRGVPMPEKDSPTPNSTETIPVALSLESPTPGADVQINEGPQFHELRNRLQILEIEASSSEP
jgi:hypothetical protein